MESYNRHAAVAYADRWWNDRNPQFPDFEVNCTNFVSQCLLAGGIPMIFSGDTRSGWWLEEIPETELGFAWSYSWALAHSMRWFLSSEEAASFAEEKASARELMPGDVIIYDFDGNGVWQHSTIVTAKDRNGEPLVNANSADSYHRNWAYRDSPSYTPQIRYKFFHIK